MRDVLQRKGYIDTHRYIVSKLSKRQRMVILKQNKRAGNG